MPFPLTEEQRAVVENRGGALLVSAAAGSGKTRVLVERLLARVEDERHDIDEFLVITFTNAAAAELRGRIAQELSQRLARDPGNSHLRRQTVLVYKARICTIDALCIDLLRQYGHLLDVDPDFRICDQAEGEAIALRVLDELLDARYEAIGDDPGFAGLVEAILTGRDDGPPDEHCAGYPRPHSKPSRPGPLAGPAPGRISGRRAPPTRGRRRGAR